jgi:hypothetical protein
MIVYHKIVVKILIRGCGEKIGWPGCSGAEVAGELH